MTSGPRRIRVACAKCDYDKVRTLEAGDDRTLEQLSASLRCGGCRTWGKNGALSVSAVLQPPPTDSEKLVRGRDPDRLFIDDTRAGSRSAPLVFGRSLRTLPAIAHPRGPAAHISLPQDDTQPDTAGSVLAQLPMFCAACLALFVALYAAAGMYGAGGVAYRSVASFLADSGDAGEPNTVCETRTAWLASGETDSVDARNRAANYLSSRCPDYRQRISVSRTSFPD
jgi:hypothetical protein